MLDAKDLRGNFEDIKRKLVRRGEDYGIDAFLELDKKRRQLIGEAEELKAHQNTVSKQVPILKKEGKDVTAIFEEMKEISEKVKTYDAKIKEIDDNIENLLLSIPNTPSDLVKDGKDESENEEIKKWGEPRVFNFEPKPHWDLGRDLDILDSETAGKVTGTRFMLYKGFGARLERALMNFFLDYHGKNGYTEVFGPTIVHRRSMIGTGQLPKFEEDAFKIENSEYFLIPTAEVPITNIHREEILDGSRLPIKYCAYSSCFRREAGSAGRDTRGLIRQHQFQKVELVKYASPETSYSELESMVLEVEKLLQMLELPYRIVCLCSGDMGFSAAMTYDIEFWMPSYLRYVEISSCTNFEGYQARRADIKFKNSPKDKAQYVHTLNGSGIPLGRTVAAILENFQNEDGTVTIPKVLVPYMGGETVIK
ncbi:MAG: serine--tRNA ligase [Defluviitaleaceae bacterium]|nr:serine--tRNA ligase [Defluviitaleaceae bacterium]